MDFSKFSGLEMCLWLAAKKHDEMLEQVGRVSVLYLRQASEAELQAKAVGHLLNTLNQHPPYMEQKPAVKQ